MLANLIFDWVMGTDPELTIKAKDRTFFLRRERNIVSIYEIDQKIDYVIFENFFIKIEMIDNTVVVTRGKKSPCYRRSNSSISFFD